MCDAEFTVSSIWSPIIIIRLLLVNSSTFIDTNDRLIRSQLYLRVHFQGTSVYIRKSRLPLQLYFMSNVVLFRFNKALVTP